MCLVLRVLFNIELQPTSTDIAKAGKIEISLCCSCRVDIGYIKDKCMGSVSYVG